MNKWSFHNPVHLHFGEGVLDDIGTLLSGRSYLLVTHRDDVMSPWRDRIAMHCGAPDLALDEIEPNPSLEMLRRLTTVMSAADIEPEVIIALGGGSVIDTAKFLAAGRGCYRAAVQYIDGGTPLPRRPLPIIAIPTTAGTGSDLTKWATVWDTVRGRKLSLEHDGLYPEATVIDPLLMASLPWSVTLSSGLDALSHALESIWNVNANPLTRRFAVNAARDIMAALQRLGRNPDDRNGRLQMALGAMRAGLAFSNTRTAVAHNISYPLTLNHDVPHGIACSFCLPEVMEAVIGIDAASDEALAEIFGVLPDAPARLRAFLNDLDVPAAAAAFGVEDSEWRMIVERAFAGPRGRNFIGAQARFPWRTGAPDDDRGQS
ncbi:iron-containing alcohol dehydrogenase [Sandaracinobacter neustonicus]|uniref:Iron-containing alcohol dehydrogenase n=1 Tax=Sandaracinobacter neustonicus TaxID=1715348 RepID=A0A501XLK0_9SPHN|nr:iron-containing alcohol dehydrogenase PsrA [Sandaracinobacter neustonicus]TPE61552.1 iron-containing alcohol dehydrogenase [Sandaracinobacter neustonicus]